MAILETMADRVILKRFEFPHEAELCASFLRDQGIDATVDDALLVGPNPLMNIAYGGVKVRINENELERANELLAELDESTNDGEESCGADSDDDAESSHSVSSLSFDEKRIRRAHAAALVGLVTLPGVVHVYSLCVALMVRDAELFAKGRGLRKFHAKVPTTRV